MTMIKLENGDYINTGNVARIYTVNCMDLIGDRGFHDEIRASFGSTSTEITPADRDRIVEAMNGKPYKPMTCQLKRALNSAAGGEA